MADRIFKPDDTNNLILSNNDGSAKLDLNEDQTVTVATGSDSGEDFSVNTTQLVVEGDTGRVGIATATPGHPFQIKGLSNAGIYFDADEISIDSKTSLNAGRIYYDTHLKIDPPTSQNVVIENGNIAIGTAGKGIDFSADSHASGMTSELLDDYEEGTFTLACSTSGYTVNTSYDDGFYTKTGRSVSIVCPTLLFSAVATASTNIIFTGLPFTASHGGTISFSATDMASDIPGVFCAEVVNATIELRMGGRTSNGNITADGYFDTGTTFRLSGTYFV